MKQKKCLNFKKNVILACLGLMLGAVNGFFGSGGGMVCVPILLALGLSAKHAHATAILTMLPTSVASSVVYYSFNQPNFEILLLVFLGACVGTILGAMFLKKISNVWLRVIFAFLVLIVGIRFCF